MSLATAPALKKTLEQRFENAVISVMRRVAGIDARRVSISDQSRHVGRMTCTQVAITGEGWNGGMVLMMPDEAATKMASRVAGAKPVNGRYKGDELADGHGTIIAAVAFEFAQLFAGEKAVTVSQPVVVTGTSVAISFPWKSHFEGRVCFNSSSGPFWGILNLSHKD